MMRATNRSGSARAGPGKASARAVCALSRESTRTVTSFGHPGERRGSGVDGESDPSSFATTAAADLSTSPTIAATSVPLSTRARYQSRTICADASAEHLHIFCELCGAAPPCSLQHRPSDEGCNSRIRLRLVARLTQCKHAEVNYLRAGLVVKKHGQPALCAIHRDARFFPLESWSGASRCKRWCRARRHGLERRASSVVEYLSHRGHRFRDDRRFFRTIDNDAGSIIGQVLRRDTLDVGRSRGHESRLVILRNLPAAKRFPFSEMICLPFHRFHSTNPSRLENSANALHLQCGNFFFAKRAHLRRDGAGSIRRIVGI